MLIFRSKVPAFLWLLIMCVLFFLPGSTLPHAGWFDIIHLDKIIHIFLFAVLVFLWSPFIPVSKNYWVAVLASAFTYGLMVEVIQGLWIPNRSFDWYDLLADMAGAWAGALIYLWVYKKNKPL